MWRLAPELRPKSPMPPLPPMDTMSNARLNAKQWIESTELVALQDVIGRILRNQGDSIQRRNLTAKDYEQMRVCAPMM